MTQNPRLFAIPIQCLIGELLKPEISNDETVTELERFRATGYSETEEVGKA